MPKNDKKAARIARIRKELIGAVIVACLVVILFYFESVIVSGPSPFYDNIFLFGIININIILVVLLVFLIIRNIVKFLYEKSANILGTKLRTKLVMAFVVVALTPTLLLFAFATSFLSGSVDNWFGRIVGEPLNEATAIVAAYQQQSCRYSQAEAQLLSSSITANNLFAEGYRETLRGMFNGRINSRQISVISLYINKTEVLRAAEESLLGQEYQQFNEVNWDRILAGSSVEEIVKTPQGVFARAAVPIAPFPAANSVIGAVVVDLLISPEISAKINELTLSQDRQKEMLSLKNPIKPPMWWYCSTLPCWSFS